MTEGKREAGANPARSRHCIRGAEATKFFFSHWETGKAVLYVESSKPGRRYSAMILKPGNLPSECTGIGSRITRYWSYDFPAPFDAPVLSCPFPLEEGFFNAPVPRVP